jgi:hypothetical protein
LEFEEIQIKDAVVFQVGHAVLYFDVELPILPILAWRSPFAGIARSPRRATAATGIPVIFFIVSFPF